MMNWATLVGGSLLAALSVFSLESWAIELAPSQAQIDHAVEQGLKAAHDGMPPNRLYAWFGSDEELKPKGFLMTKVSGLTVLASHFGLRGAQPSNQDIQRILNEETMLVSITFYGDTSTFAKDSYVVLEQGDRLIKPVTVRFDAVAHRTVKWPDAPAFQAKIIGSFPYNGFDPLAQTTILVFPRQGGKISFEFDFSSIP